MQTQWYEINLYCSKEIKDFLLKLAYGQIEACEAQKNEGTTECDAYGNECEANNCYFKQLARKTQECEKIKEKYEALKLENQEGYEIVAELKHECKEQEDKIKKLRKNLALEIESTDHYRKALDEIEEYTKNFKELDVFEDIKDIINKAKGKGEENE